MSTWKTAAAAAAFIGAAGLGAAVAPVAHGQDRTVTAGPAIQVISGGAQLGVTVRDVAAVDVKSGQPAGVAIEEVSDESPAAAAGLRAGDVVVEYDGERVRSVRQFTRLVQESVPGRAVTLVVLRDGQRQTLTATPRETGVFRRFGDDFYALGESLRGLRVERAPRPPSPPAPPAPPRWEFPDIDAFVWRGSSTLGITTSDLSPQLAEYFGVKDGVLVASVREGSVAARTGVEAGDVVTAVNGREIGSPADLRRELQRIEAGGEFTLEIVRDRKAMTLKGKMEDRSPRRAIRTIV